MKLVIELPGNPVPKGRPRFGRGHAYTPSATALYERSLAWAAKAAMKGQHKFKGPLRINVTAYVAIPEKYNRTKRLAALSGMLWPRGDVDNFAKICLDACNGIVFEDDAQVVVLMACKVFASTPMMRVEVEPLFDSQEESAEKRCAGQV